MSNDRIREMRAGVEYVKACLRDIHEKAGDGKLSPEEQTRWDEGVSHCETVEAEIVQAEERARFAATLDHLETVEEPAEKPAQFNIRKQVDPFDLSQIQRDNDSPKAAERDLVERARRAVGEMDDVYLEDRSREEIERKVRTVRPERGYSAARHVLRTSSPEYMSGWAKAMSGKTEFLTAAERDALQTADQEYRAASTTTTAGGFNLPTPIDPSIILTADVSVNPWRRISRVETVMNDNGWTGVSSAGITASWDTEGSEVSDDAPTFSQPTVAVHKAAGFVPFSIEIGDDWAGLMTEMAREFAEAKDSLEGAAFATGTGTNQPTGIVTALSGSSEVAMATNSTFAVGDLFTAQQALQSRHQGNAVWVMNLVHINDIREFGGTSYYTRSTTLEADATGGTGAGRVLGKPVYESSDLSSTLDGDTNNNIVYGNFRNFVIADRIGVRTEFIPHLFATGNNRPSGQRGLYMHWRVGSDSVNDSAFQLLYNPST